MMRYPWLCMYAETPWLARRGLHESPTTAMIFDRFSKSAMGSDCGSEAKAPPDSLLVRGFQFLLVHLQRQLADRFRNFFVRRQIFQILDQQVLHQTETQVERSTWIPYQVSHNFVILHEAALQRDLAQHGFQHVFLAGKFFHLAIGQLRGFEHRQGDDLSPITDQDRALFL